MNLNDITSKNVAETRDPSDTNYDRYGRLCYTPGLHAKHKAPWTTTDQKYLIENYETLGPEATCLALERTIHTVMQRVCELRKQGLMSKPSKRSYHRRMRRTD